jgi:hypothetical protein
LGCSRAVAVCFRPGPQRRSKADSEYVLLVRGGGPSTIAWTWTWLIINAVLNAILNAIIIDHDSYANDDNSDHHYLDQFYDEYHDQYHYHYHYHYHVHDIYTTSWRWLPVRSDDVLHQQLRW